MPTPLSFTVLSERPAGIPEPHRGGSALAVDFILTRTGVIDRRIDLARALKRNGLTLSEAHAALNALVGNVTTGVTLIGSREATVVEFARSGVSARAA